MFIYYEKTYIVVAINNIVFIVYFRISNEDTMVYKIVAYPNIFNCIYDNINCNVGTYIISSIHNVYDGSGDVITYNKFGFSANFLINAIMTPNGTVDFNVSEYNF